MAKFLFVVFTEPKPGRDDEYNEWYDTQHVTDTLAVEGFTGAQRYVLADMEPAQTGSRYLALYEVEADDIQKVSGAIAQARANGRMPISDAMDRGRTVATFYVPLGD